MQDDVPYPTPPDPLAGRESEFGELSPDERLPDGLGELPPVEPPSAGFIVQLFLVPALIVSVVIGVYLLFGQLASSEQDWRKQLTDIRSDNPHVRWRGALGLAQMLQADATADGVRLVENRDVATEMAGLLQDSLDRASASEDDFKQQEFLTRTLGLIDVHDVTFPVLVSAMNSVEDREVRKNAIASLATAANRLHEQGKSFDEGEIVAEIIAASGDSDSMIRHLATYSLGLFDAPAAEERLEVLLGHGDELTRMNAAIALARLGSLAGMPVFEGVLRSCGSPGAAAESSPSDADVDSTDATEAAARQFESTLKVTNTLKALSALSGQLDTETMERLAALLIPIADDHADALLRVEAQELLMQLQAAR